MLNMSRTPNLLPSDEALARPIPDAMALREAEQIIFSRVLKAALWHAKKLHCHVDQFLVRAGLIPESQFYESLAARLGVSYIPFPVLLDPTIPPTEALEAGLAPVDPKRNHLPPDTPVFIYAPQGPRLEWFIRTEARSLEFPSIRIGITTPSTFLASVRATFGSEITEHAITKLVKRCPRASAASLRPIIWITLLLILFGILVASAAITTSIWHGSLFILTAFPILPGLIIKILAFRTCVSQPESVHIISDWKLPTYTVLVPVYREAEILSQLVDSLQKLDYPRSKLDIKLLVEADDVETLTALNDMHLPAYFDVVICPRGAPRTKPRALSIGLAYSTSDLVVVYDAEDIPDHDQLKKAASIFATHKKLACLQARLTIDNLADSWLTRQFALEYSALFDVLLPGLAELRQPIPLGGTSNHFRRQALEKIGAWDSWNVTEDADLGLRLYRAGYSILTFDSTTHEEAPSTYRTWMHQRMRWLKGWMQTALVHMRSHHNESRRLTIVKWIALFLAASLSPISILLHPALLLVIDVGLNWITQNNPKSFVDNLIQIGFACMFFGSLYLDILITRRGAEKRKISLNLKDFLSLIPYSLLKTWAGWRALIELIYAPYHWRKTTHGLARTSRLKADQTAKTAS